MLAVFLAATAFAQGDFQKGIAAFNTEDYVTARAEWQPLAESGDLNAMYNLGLIYDEGLGVDVDKGRALEWYMPPAEEGDVAAQFNVASIYDFGQGIHGN